MCREDRPRYFLPWAAILDRWLAVCDGLALQPLDCALRFVLSYSGIERVVVGVDSLRQLEQILAVQAHGTTQLPDDLFCEDRLLIEPWRWSLT